MCSFPHQNQTLSLSLIDNKAFEFALKCIKPSSLLTFYCYSNGSNAKSLWYLHLVIMDVVGLSAMYFASNTIPTTFGTVAAAFAGAGSLLLIALRFVPEAKN